MIFKKTSLVAGLLLFIAIVSACQTQPNQVFIEVDGARQALVTEVATVRDALQEAEVELGNLDHVDPDLYVQLESGLTIIGRSVESKLLTERKQPNQTQKLSSPYEWNPKFLSLTHHPWSPRSLLIFPTEKCTCTKRTTLDVHRGP